MKKRCSKCHKYKKLTEFYKRKDSRDGLRSLCEECCGVYNKEWAQKNRERFREYNHKYYKSEKGRIAKEKNSIKYRKTAKGKEMNLRAACKRRSIFKNEQQAFTLTLDQWLQTLKYFKNRCAYCGKKSRKLVREHAIPLERGGWHTRENVIPACNSCNLLKGRKIPFLEWEPPKFLSNITAK